MPDDKPDNKTPPPPENHSEVRDKDGNVIPDENFENDFPPMAKPPAKGENPLWDHGAQLIERHKKKPTS
jgi:hypothetical protein